MKNNKQVLRAFMLLSVCFYFLTNVMYAQKITFAYSATQLSQPLYKFEPGSIIESCDLIPKIKEAKLNVLLDWNTAYLDNVTTTYTANINIKAYQGNTFIKDIVLPLTLTIDKKKPQAYAAIDYTDIYADATRFDVTVDYVRNGAQSVLLENSLKTEVYITKEFIYNYNNEPSIENIAPIQPYYTANKTEVLFKWLLCPGAPNYQFQLLRLYNKDPNKIQSEGNIVTDVDWSRALTIETGNAKQELKLTLTEGTGYYLWRVRPIGNKYAGGIANDLNWGPWTDVGPYDGTSERTINSITPNAALMIQNTSDPWLFFYNQFDNDKNWIFTRSFVEGDALNKGQVNIGESMNYANGLQMQQQQQTRLKTEGAKMVNQTIYDYSARPALTTLPAIEEDGDLGYIHSYVKRAADDVIYTAADFDADFVDNSTPYYKAPSEVSTVSGPGKYYSDANTIEDNVASAEGFPYSRTLYMTDGTSKPKEQSAPGETYKIGSTHTTRNKTSSVSDAELIKMFGDEAPAANSVYKSITADANGTVTVSYISKEGKTLATCLATPGATNLDALQPDPDATNVTFDIKNNTPYGNGGLRSFQNIVVTELVPTPVTIQYDITAQKYQEADDCSEFCATCDYKISIRIIDNENNKPYPINGNDVYTIIINPDENCAPDQRTPTLTVSLPEGSYTVERIVETNQVNPTNPPEGISAQSTYHTQLLQQIEREFIGKFTVTEGDQTSTPATGVGTAYVKNVVNNVEQTIETKIDVHMHDINFYLQEEDITGLYTYLGVLPEHPELVVPNSSAFVLLELDDCTIIRIPVLGCEVPEEPIKTTVPGILEQVYDFETIFKEWYVSKFSADPSTVNINLLFENGEFEDGQPFNDNDFNIIVTNMLDKTTLACPTCWKYDKIKLLEHFKSIYISKFADNVNYSTPNPEGNPASVNGVTAPSEGDGNIPKPNYFQQFIDGAEYDKNYIPSGLTLEDDLPKTGYQIQEIKPTAGSLVTPGYKYYPHLYIKYTNGDCLPCEKVFNEQIGVTVTDFFNHFDDYPNIIIANNNKDYIEKTIPADPANDLEATKIKIYPRNDFAKCLSMRNSTAKPTVFVNEQEYIDNLVTECKRSCNERLNIFKASIADMYHKNGQEIENDPYQLVLNDDNVYVWGTTALPTGVYDVSQQTLSCQAANAVFTCESHCDLTGYMELDKDEKLEPLRYMQQVMYGKFDFQLPIYNENTNDYECSTGGYSRTLTRGTVPSALNMEFIIKNLNEELGVQVDNSSNFENSYWQYKPFLQNLMGASTIISSNQGDDGTNILLSRHIPIYFEYDAISGQIIYFFNKKIPGENIPFRQIYSLGSENVLLKISPFDSNNEFVYDNFESLTSGFSSGYYVGSHANHSKYVGPNFNVNAANFSNVDEMDPIVPLWRYFLNNGDPAYWKLGSCTVTSIVNCAPLCYKILPAVKINVEDETIKDELVTYKQVTCVNENASTIKASIAEQVNALLTKRLESVKAAYRKKCIDEINDQFTVSYGATYHHYTLYYYDRVGNLIRTVPPEGVVLTSTTRAQHPAHTMVTEYNYNSLGQLISQKTPDGGVTNFWYDNKARLRFSQNAKQSAAGKKSYTKYDKIGRIVEVGELVMAGVPSDDQLNKDYPAAGVGSDITVTTYSNRVAGGYYNGKSQRFLQNRVSATYTDKDGNSYTTNDRISTFYSYDPHGNVEWLIQHIPELGIKHIAYEYDLISGSVIKVKYNEGKADQFYHRYTYDIDKRIKTVETSKDNLVWEQDANYKYYLHGPLKRSIIGHDQLQGLDYVYTLQGWLKAMNHTDFANDPGKDGNMAYGTIPKDAFSMLLTYHTDDFVRTNSPFNSNSSNLSALLPVSGRDLFNGNISTWTNNYDYDAMNPLWTITNPQTTGRTFKYDELNRITDATYNTYASNTWTSESIYHESFSYYANGNIKTLDRNGNNAAPHERTMDALNYYYTAGTNKLSHVTDGTSYADNYDSDIDHGQIAGNYQYDAIGNLTSDTQEGISNITWNVYGKIGKITKTDGTNIEFLYDAAGKRVYKKVYKTNAADLLVDAKTTYYVLDATGNAMAVYGRDNTALGNNIYKEEYSLKEQSIYGSDRLGVRTPNSSESIFDSYNFNGTTLERVDINEETVDACTNLAASGFTTASTDEELNTVDVVADNTINCSAPTCTISPASQAVWGKQGKNTAVYENNVGAVILKSISMRQYNNATDVTLITNSKGEYYNTVGLKNYAGGKSIFIKKPGNTNEFYYFTIGADQLPYYHALNGSDATLGIQKNNTMEPDQSYTYSYGMALFEDQTGNNNSQLYMKRSKGNGSAQLVRYQIDAEGITGPYFVDEYLSGESFSAFSELQISPTGTNLMVANNLGTPNVFGVYSEGGELRQYALNADHTTNYQNLSSTYYYGFNTVAKSFDYNKTSDKLLYNKAMINNSKMLTLAINSSSMSPVNTIVLNSTTGDVRRGANGNLYVANTYGKVKNKIIEIQTSDENTWTSAEYETTQNLSGTLALNNHRLTNLFSFLEPEPVQLSNRSLESRLYELKDHLGNVRAVISDKKMADVASNAVTKYKADITSVSDYYAFGAPMPGRNFTSANGYRYGFNGQEKDDEVYGSGNLNTAEFWQYDTRLGRRWNQDPKPNPSISNYATFANNSILFNDLLGDEIDITHRKGFLGLGGEETLKYENGKLFNKDGSDYTGKVNGFLRQTVSALDKVDKTKEGSEMMTELMNSKNVFNIKEGFKNEFVEKNSYKAFANQYATDPIAASVYATKKTEGVDFSGGSGGTVYFNPRNGWVWEQGGQQANRPSVSLGHELFHGLDANRGMLDSREHLGITRSEWQASYRENVMRQQMGLPLRTDYKTIYDPNTNTSQPGGPKLLDNGGSPILPSWYRH